MVRACFSNVLHKLVSIRAVPTSSLVAVMPSDTEDKVGAVPANAEAKKGAAKQFARSGVRCVEYSVATGVVVERVSRGENAGVASMGGPDLCGQKDQVAMLPSEDRGFFYFRIGQCTLHTGFLLYTPFTTGDHYELCQGTAVIASFNIYTILPV